MRSPQIIGNDKAYYIEKDYMDIWRFEEDFQITREDLPYLKKAIKLLEKKLKYKNPIDKWTNKKIKKPKVIKFFVNKKDTKLKKQIVFKARK